MNFVLRSKDEDLSKKIILSLSRLGRRETALFKTSQVIDVIDETVKVKGTHTKLGNKKNSF